MKRIVICHSWSHNMGDAAMLHVIAQTLHHISPDFSITALVSHPEFSAPRCAKADVRLQGWPWPVENAGIVERAFGYPAIFLSNMASAAIFRIFGKKVFFLNRRFEGALGSIFDCDVLISPGGDFMGPRYFFLTAFGELIMGRLLGKRVVVCAQTIGPFPGFFEKRLAAFVLRMADLVIAREGATARHLRELGIKGVEETTDLAFMYPEPPRAKRRKRIIMSPKGISGRSDSYVQGMRSLAGRLSGDLGYELIFLPSDSHDMTMHDEIASGLPGNVRVVRQVHPPDEIARIISESEFVVSSRMHAIILAALSRTPFFAIGDSFKFGEILGGLCEDCTIGTDGLNKDGISRVILALERRGMQEEEIRKRYPAVLEKSRRNADILRHRFIDWGLAPGNPGK